jgi:hypothetical protein
MDLNCVRADVEITRDFFVAGSLGNQRQDFAFTMTQLIGFRHNDYLWSRVNSQKNIN